MINEILFENSFLWNCLWQSTLCIGAGLLVSFIYKGRASRGHRVLFLAMAAAVMVPVISAMVKHYELGIFVTEQAPSQIKTEEVPRSNSYYMPEFLPAEEVEYTPGTTTTAAPPAAISQPQSIYIPWRSIVIWGWSILSLVLLVRLLVTFILGIRLLGRAESLNCQEIQAAAGIARAKLGISKNIEVYKSSKIKSPVIWCWSSEPTLLVPSSAESSGKAIDWVSVLCHELAHWKRHDHISGLLAEVMVCVFPWNPLMWWGKRRMVSLSEQACDDWVLASGQLDTNYAQSLLDLAPQGRMAFVPAVVGSKKTLVERIRRILKGQCDKPKTGTLWVLTVSTAVICMVLGIAFAQTRQVKITEASITAEVKETEGLQATGRGIGGGMGGGMMGGMGGVTESDTGLPLIEESRFDNAQSSQTQIAVESRFLTVDGKFLEDIGLSKDIFDKPANSRESKIIDDLNTTFILRATQSDEKSKILAAPKITVLDGESSEISITNERRYISGYTPAADTDGEPEAKQDSEVIGITIALKPRLLEDDKIFMDI
ncbi:MAG: M56 family metallopeptidase, partial [Planctomycetota bacterium]